MENGKLKIIGAARAEITLIADLIRDLLRITRMRFRLGGRNERSSESRVKLAWAMPRFPNCVRLPVAFRDDIAESNEG